MASTTQELHDKFEPKPNPQQLAGTEDQRNVSSNVDYEPHPEQSLSIPQQHKEIIDHITNLYSGCSSEADMSVYAEEAIYDEPFSYCDTRYKVAGQCYGLPKDFSRLRTLRTWVVEDSPHIIIFKLQQKYTPIVLHRPVVVNSLVSLSLDDAGKIRYHKDQWNEKDYSHEGLGKLFKKLNGDHLTKDHAAT